jgi:hypothetical protein
MLGCVGHRQHYSKPLLAKHVGWSPESILVGMVAVGEAALEAGPANGEHANARDRNRIEGWTRPRLVTVLQCSDGHPPWDAFVGLEIVWKKMTMNWQPGCRMHAAWYDGQQRRDESVTT